MTRLKFVLLLALGLFLVAVGQVRATEVCNYWLPNNREICCTYGWVYSPPCKDFCGPDDYNCTECKDSTPYWGCARTYFCDEECREDPSPTPSPGGGGGGGGDSCPNVSADIKANDSDGPIAVSGSDIFTLSWTSTNATHCVLEGINYNPTDSVVKLITLVGEYEYDLSCYNSCDAGTDRVTVEILDPCGDGNCAGFENCLNCETDCGACPAHLPWWQTWGGHLGAESTAGHSIFSFIPEDTVCLEPSCFPYLSALDRAGTTHSDGFPLVRGIIMANESISARGTNTFALNTLTTRLRENYTYFYKRYSLGFSPEDDFYHTDLDAREPTESKEAYFHLGDLVIQSPWDVTSGESYVIFVDGDLNIEDPLSEGELIKVAEGGFLAFIVTGDINIAESVGHTTLTNTEGNIEGVYIANGTINIMSNNGLDKRFIGEGTFVGWTSVNMARSFDDGVDNELYPTETFIYRPDFVRYVPERMKRPQMLWQETN